MNHIENGLLVGFNYENDNPCLLIDIKGGSQYKRTIFPLKNRSITMQKLETRRCIGRYDLRTFVSTPCPEMNMTTDNTVCISCFRANGFNPSFYNVSREEISPQQREYNLNSHNVYLAYFGGHTCKVGISNKKRTMIRWCEQGARAATIVKTCNDAYDARELEFLISSKLKLPDVINGNTKRKYINERFDRDKALNVLKQTKAIIANSICEIDENEIVYLDEKYLVEVPLDTDIIDMTKNEVTYISGKFIALIGDNIIVAQQGRQFVVSLKKFISYEVTFLPTILPYAIVASQMGLF